MISACGTWAWYTAAMARAPKRKVPRFSATRPMFMPARSVSVTSGRWNVSHRSTKRVTAIAPSTDMVVPLCGSGASTPTACPPSRASAVTQPPPYSA